MSNSNYQKSSRQPSEEPSVQTNDLNLAIGPSQASTFALVNYPTEHVRQHISWPRYLASITPLICGGLGPTITLLALSGCADRWRTEVIDGRLIEEPDPKWVIIVTSVAISVGFLANIFLLLRILDRGNPKHLQILCIVFWALECLPPPRSHFLFSR